MKLFGVTYQESESTRRNLKRFNEEMFKIEKLLESVALEALIREVREYTFYRKLNALPDRSLLKMKQVMKIT
jgi:hypothetical protein